METLPNHQVLENEAAIIERAKSDDSAFEILYNHYFPKIYGYILKRTGHHEAAQDLVSEIFIKVFCNLTKYSHQDYGFSAWIFRIATNHLIDHYRQSNRQKEINFEAIQDLAAVPANPQDLVQAEKNKKIVNEIINQLPRRYQKIINLKYFAELSNEEIALALSVSRQNVRVLIHRTLRKFQKLYQKYGQ